MRRWVVYLRIIIPIALMVLCAIGYIFAWGTGTISAFGWGDVALICPLGALTTMLATKTFIPEALISLAIVIVVVLIVGRAFCSWVCPAQVVSRWRNAFRRKDNSGNAATSTDAIAERPADSKQGSGCGTQAGCAACAGANKRSLFDSRHLVLLGALLSALIFGFPVFCLVCPVGLCFTAVILMVRLFGMGDVSWSIIVVFALLFAEVVFFRHWCSKICPLGALMSLISKGNRTFRPRINTDKCIEATTGATCGRCAASCERHIDLRVLEKQTDRCECTRCGSCVTVCPAHAIQMPLFDKYYGKAKNHVKARKQQ